MGLTLSFPTAGRSLLTCARCSAVRTRRLRMFRRTLAPIWRKNERAFTDRAGAGRRIFREQPFHRSFVPPRIDCCGGAGALRPWRVRESASAQLFMALCLCVFLYTLRWLLFLDNRPSCQRRRMVGHRPPPVGKYCGIAGGPGASFRANSSSPPSSLLVDGHSTGRGSFARFKTGLSQLEFLSVTRRIVPRLFCFCIARVAPVVRATGSGR